VHYNMHIILVKNFGIDIKEGERGNHAIVFYSHNNGTGLSVLLLAI
jgi:hypothetical protein